MLLFFLFFICLLYSQRGHVFFQYFFYLHKRPPCLSLTHSHTQTRISSYPALLLLTSLRYWLYPLDANVPISYGTYLAIITLSPVFLQRVVLEAGALFSDETALWSSHVAGVNTNNSNNNKGIVDV